jgi:hypothetical protein
MFEVKSVRGRELTVIADSLGNSDHGLEAVVDRALGVRPVSKDERPVVSAFSQMIGSNDLVYGHQTTEIANDRFWSAASGGRRCVAVGRFEPFLALRNQITLGGFTEAASLAFTR